MALDEIVVCMYDYSKVEHRELVIIIMGSRKSILFYLPRFPFVTLNSDTIFIFCW